MKKPIRTVIYRCARNIEPNLDKQKEDLIAYAQDADLKVIGDFSDNDEGWGIATDSMGNVYTTGSFDGSFDFDPGVGTYNLTADSEDVFVLKLGRDGSFLWARNMGGNLRSGAGGGSHPHSSFILSLCSLVCSCCPPGYE